MTSFKLHHAGWGMLKRPTLTSKCRHKIAAVGTRSHIAENDSNLSDELHIEGEYINNIYSLSSNILEVADSSKRNFFLIVNNIPEDAARSEAEQSQRSLANTLNSLTSSEKEKLDSVRSGESLIKHYNFDSSTHNRDTDKCAEFWRALKKTNIKPVNCALLKPDDNSMEEPERDLTEKQLEDTGMWYKALVELQRRKMDNLAFAAGGERCRYCDREEPYAKFKKRQGPRFSEKELNDSEDIKCLNHWHPKSNCAKKTTPIKYSAEPFNKAIVATSVEVLDEDVTNEYEENDWLIEGNYYAEEENARNNSFTETDKKDYTFPNLKIENPDYENNMKADDTPMSSYEDHDNRDKLRKETSNISLKSDPSKCFLKSCRAHCKCMEHEEKLTREYVNVSTDMLEEVVVVAKRNKGCQTDNKVVVIEDTTANCNYCNVCGHDDCNCHSSLKSKPADFRSAILDFQRLNKTVETKTQDEGAKQKPCDQSLKQLKVKKKVCITPEQKAIKIQTKLILTPDKYGIPQVVQYTDGKSKSNC